jgi:hypothetical protein
MAENQNSWNEYSKLVLKELETLAVGISNLSSEIQDIKREIALIKDREDKVEKLQEWKDKVSEVVSPSQLSDMVKEVKDLKEFKTKAITIFVVIQSIMAMAMAVLNYMK